MGVLLTLFKNDNTENESVLSTWGLVGSAVNDWGGDNQGYTDGNDIPFVTTSEDSVFRAAVTFKEGEFKIRRHNSWAETLGGNTEDGKLEQGGDNISVEAGNYIVEFNSQTLKYTITNTELYGIVGTSTINGWSGPDLKLINDPFRTNVYMALGINLNEGSLKIRKNDSYTENYGPETSQSVKYNGTNSFINDGNNFEVKSGSYDIFVDLSNNKFGIIESGSSRSILSNYTPATVTINILAVDDAPVATPQSIKAIEQTEKTIELSGSDVENDTITNFIITDLPTQGLAHNDVEISTNDLPKICQIHKFLTHLPLILQQLMRFILKFKTLYFQMSLQKLVLTLLQYLTSPL